MRKGPHSDAVGVAACPYCGAARSVPCRPKGAGPLSPFSSDVHRARRDKAIAATKAELASGGRGPLHKMQLQRLLKKLSSED